MPRAGPNSNTFTFTEKLLERLLPPGHPSAPTKAVEYTDAKTPGLKLAASASGRRFWYLRLRVGGRKICFHLGEHPGVTLAAARQEAWRLRSLTDRGIDPRQKLRRDATDALNFRAFAMDRYLPHAQDTKKSWRDDWLRLTNHLVPRWGDRPLSSITAADIQEYVGDVRRRTSPATANRHLSLIKRMMNLAYKWEIVQASPAVRISKYREPPPRERYLSDAEITVFLAALDQCEPDSANILRLLLFSGMRRGEALSLRRENVDLQGRMLNLPTSKSGRTRHVPLNELAVKALEDQFRRRPDGPWVFPAETATGHRHDVRGTFKRACRLAGITNFVTHGLRHTAASLMVQSGATLYEVQHVLGHLVASTTQRYSHICANTLHKTSARISDHINGLAKPKEP